MTRPRIAGTRSHLPCASGLRRHCYTTGCASAAWGRGLGTRIDVEGRVLFPHSLGIFYEAITQFIGFPHYGDEYKVMGLAPYGTPVYLDAMRRIVLLEDDGGF